MNYPIEQRDGVKIFGVFAEVGADRYIKLCMTYDLYHKPKAVAISVKFTTLTVPALTCSIFPEPNCDFLLTEVMDIKQML